MSSHLIEQLVDTHGYTLLTEETRDDFLNQTEHAVLFFTEDPTRFHESNDVAVVLPELIKVFGDQITPAVVDRRIEKDLQKAYGFRAWPSLVFLRRGEYLGAISRMSDWDDYLSNIRSILASEPSSPPSIAIPDCMQHTDSNNSH
jgi:hydrogenase-1 operon protein HyaE